MQRDESRRTAERTERGNSSASGVTARGGRARGGKLLLALALFASQPLAAQSRLDLGGALLPQGEELRYLRNLSLVDSAAGFDVTLQPTSASAAARARAHAAATANHPWNSRFRTAAQPRVFGEARANSSAGLLGAATALNLRLLRPEARALFLSDRPFTVDDGVAWSGRGGTLVLQGGASAQWKRLRMQLAPVAFIAQNSAFALAPNSYTDARKFRDARFPNTIDLPQRFGESSYSRLDLGDSFIEADAGPATFGISTARQHWGPAREYPLTLGTGSGGFPHLFVGSSRPLNVYVGTLHLRLMGAKLAQSRYSPIDTGETSRFLSGAVMSFRPGFAPSLELGASRLVNGPWPADGYGLREFLLPFEGIINDNEDAINQNENNGFAAVFIRFAPAGAGLELYGELSREDFAGDLRQLYLEPDDLVHYTLGIARARRDVASNAMRVFRIELVNGEVSHFEREGRSLNRPIAPYTHGRTRQGLTNRGQLLGSAAAFGGAGATLAWDRITEQGRRSITLDRTLLRDWLPALGPTGGVPQGEVTYRLKFEQLRFRGDAEWAFTLAPHYTLNRNLARGHDALGLELQLRWQGW